MLRLISKIVKLGIFYINCNEEIYLILLYISLLALMIILNIAIIIVLMFKPSIAREVKFCLLH